MTVPAASRLGERLKRPIPTAVGEFLSRAPPEGVHWGDVFLYGEDVILERNATFGIDELPGWVAVGDDGGGDLFLLRATEDAREVHRAHLSSPDVSELITRDFAFWTAVGAPLPPRPKNPKATIGCVRLVGQPSLRELLLIRRTFAPDVPLSAFRAAGDPSTRLLVGGVTRAWYEVKLSDVPAGARPFVTFAEDSPSTAK